MDQEDLNILKDRLAFWPFGYLFKRKCNFSGENIISPFSENAHFPIYKRKYWFSDDWALPEMDIDFEKPFFDQLYALQCRVPHFHQMGRNNENCDYADDVWDSKNIYLSRSLADSEDILYSYRIISSRNCLDITYCYNLELCYECIYCFNCFNLKYSENCRDCRDCSFLYDCRGCSDCMMCWNLRNKKYHILNKAYSKEEYLGKIRDFDSNSIDQFENHLKEDAYHNANQNNNIENSGGNYLTNCKNCSDCFFLEDSEDCDHVIRGLLCKNCADSNGIYKGEKCSNIMQSTDIYNVNYALFSFNCSDSDYIDQCVNCRDIFGCIGLKNGRYCIFNKQYLKEDYFKLREKFLREIENYQDKFFPLKFAYSGFNLSLSAFYFDETEDSIRSRGGYFEKIPDFNNFKFIEQETAFYQRMNLPKPSVHPELRNKRRFIKLKALTGREKLCFLCGKNIITYYPEELGYKKIICEDCYLKQIY